MNYERMGDGSLRVAVLEPFWFKSWRTLFLWRPGCNGCRTIYRTRAEYADHYITVHAYDEAQP